ncbi:MAG: hypothetical protein FWD63_01880 [Propionibacteriaceae bacterium]|nr:hypothetical protein [Propionibacteriaceae bacterium]
MRTERNIWQTVHAVAGAAANSGRDYRSGNKYQASSGQLEVKVGYLPSQPVPTTVNTVSWDATDGSRWANRPAADQHNRGTV